MLIILLLLVPIVGLIARTARGRGLSPWLFGSLAVAGWLLLSVLETFALDQSARHEPGYGSSVANPGTRMAIDLAVMSARWAWLGLVFVYVRFVHGRGHAGAQGRWTCPDCGWLNEVAFIKCESCHCEYREIAPTA